jgi:hypothetical protein
VKSISKVLELLAPHKDWYFSDQAMENLYRIILNLLAYINEPMAKDHILYYKTHPFIDRDLKNMSIDIIMEGMTIFAELAKAEADEYLFQNEHLHILFSLYLIIFYEDKLRPNPSLDGLFGKVHEFFKKLLAEYKGQPDSDSNDILYKYYRLLIVVLRANDFNGLAADFDVPQFAHRSGGFFASSESQYPKTMWSNLWILKRPGFQVNGYYYNDIESKLKLDTTTFF